MHNAKKDFFKSYNIQIHEPSLGQEKVEEIKQYLENHEEVNLVIFDDDLSGKQTNILESTLKGQNSRPNDPDPRYFLPIEPKLLRPKPRSNWLK
ncbi:MAG: hypothetical protein R2769_06915 [Saprospiraceae bacterium]